MKIDLNKKFYLIASYWCGKIDGFVTIGDDKEEIIKIFEDRYMITPRNSWGVTEASYKLLEVNAKEILNDMSKITED